MTLPHPALSDAAELGVVDSRGVAVWVRAPGQTEVHGTLAVEGQPSVTVSVTLSEETDWTGMVRLDLPQPSPDAPFTCEVLGRRLSGRLAPLPGAPASLAFGFGSCHMPYHRREDGSRALHAGTRIYPAMHADLERAGARLLLLTGDQIYADHPAAPNIAELLPGAGVPSMDAAVTAYRSLYHAFFGEPGVRTLRERFSTLYTWDDHEIVNDWGSRPEVTERDRVLFTAASRVYAEYQHQRNPGGGTGPPPYHFIHQFGDIGFLALDLRGARDHEHGRLLGKTQWRAVQDYLAGAEAAAVRTLFVVAGVPVAHVSRWFTLAFEHAPLHMAQSVRDRWSSSAFIHSRDELLDALFEWRSGAPHRQVIILSGDVHAAAAFRIRDRAGRGLIHQFTSSPLTTPLSRFQDAMNLLATRSPDLFEPRYRIRRRFLRYGHNFGLVRVEPLAAGGHRVSFAVRVWDDSRQRLHTGASIRCSPPATG
jgi:alkaline phosphatase D